MRTDANASGCTRGCTDTVSLHSLRRQGIEPRSVLCLAFRFDTLPATLPHVWQMLALWVEQCLSRTCWGGGWGGLVPDHVCHLRKAVYRMCSDGSDPVPHTYRSKHIKGLKKQQQQNNNNKKQTKNNNYILGQNTHAYNHVLNKVVNVCGKGVGERQEQLRQLYERRVVRKASVIVDDNSHVLTKHYEFLPSG